jgi:hypothetical protein
MNRRKFITLVSAAAAWPLAPQFKGRYSTASIAFLASSTIPSRYRHHRWFERARKSNRGFVRLTKHSLE